MTKKIVITGIGLVTPVGIGKKPTWESLLQGKSGISRISQFDPSPYRCQIAGEIKNWDFTALTGLDKSYCIDRSAQFSFVATKMAIEDSGIDFDTINSNRVGVSLGTGLGGIMFGESQLQRLNNALRVHPLTVPQVNPNNPSSLISMHWKLKGPNISICTACASGSHAIGQALYLMRLGKADILLAGGTEAIISPLCFAGFDSLRVMSTKNNFPEKASCPFDKNRSGFVMGEGAAMLVLETEESALKRGATIYSELAGYGATSGAYHSVAPEPNGEDAIRSMNEALNDAKLTTNDVDYINAHGTATVHNDLSETKAIKELFGKNAYRIPVSSIKGSIGHLIGAAGAVEAAITALSLSQGIITPTLNYETPDPNCDLDYVPNIARKTPLKVALSNSFGFGNNNASLVLKKHESLKKI